MSSHPKRQRNVARLLSWAQRRSSLPHPAQAALDAANEDAAPARAPRGNLYRKDCYLSDLLPGECGTILRLTGGTMRSRLRLLEMGLTPGVHVKILRAAAFGGPLDILVRGYQLSLRRDEAAAIWLGEEDEE